MSGPVTLHWIGFLGAADSLRHLTLVNPLNLIRIMPA